MFDLDQSRIYVHDSVLHVRKDQISKRSIVSRDVGGKYFPASSGVAYRYGEVERPLLRDDYVLSFFTGTRPNSVGFPRKDGKEKRVIDLQIGRNVRSDDLKGLPDGVVDPDGLYTTSFSFGVFKSEEVLGGQDYKEAFAEQEDPIHHLKQELILSDMKSPKSTSGSALQGGESTPPLQPLPEIRKPTQIQFARS